MFFVDLISKLKKKIISAGIQFYHRMIVIILTVIAFCAKKILLYTLWMFVVMSINLFWVMKGKKKCRLILPVNQLIASNAVITLTFVEVEWMTNNSTECDLACKMLIWLQTTTLMLSAAFTLHTLDIFICPENDQRNTIKSVLLIYFVCSLLGLAQVSIQMVKILLHFY